MEEVLESTSSQLRRLIQLHASCAGPRADNSVTIQVSRWCQEATRAIERRL